MKKEIVIEKASVSTLSISGSAKQKDMLRAKFVEIKGISIKFGGKILREEEFEDGYFLEIAFASTSLKDVFESQIGL